MDGRVIRGVQRAALKQWNEFIAMSLATRLDPDKFESYVPFLQAKHPLPPSVVADLFLRPQPHNHESLDPRVPRFLQVLSDLNYIDTPSILEALYKYSTSRAHSREAAQASNGGNPTSQTLRWASSYSAEEVMFYRLTKSVAQGTAIPNTETGLAIAKIMASWIALFTDAATAFTVDVMGQLQNSQAREEMESARAAFVALLLGVCENHTVMKAFGSPEAKMRESSIEGLLGETPYQNLPAGGRYVKDNLVAECLADPERMQALIGELDGKDGNAGAVCQALTEVLGQLCRNKETMSLKLLCSQLAQKPLSLDVMLLFEKPATILHPLCDLLDNWKYDEDQGEYQPVYEEFGSILLLVMAFAYRYNLSISDLGIVSPDSFVSKLLGQGHQSRVFDELSEQQKGHLDGWIHGLFDSEAGGLGDELMSSCPPQDFYLLVSTLFQNIVLAFSTGHLSEESLRGGVEYLVDTFLLPSLVVAITYLSNSLLIERSECQKAIVRVLKSVLEPTSISKEASDMLSSVMNIVAKPLEHSLVQWSIHPAMDRPPPTYTHRQILVALIILGAKRLLQLIYEDIRQHSEAGSGSIVYDVAANLVCAPDANDSPWANALNFMDNSGNMPAPIQKKLTMREVLKSDAENCKRLQKTDMNLAEIVVRLHRKVESQMVVAQAAAIQADTMLQNDLGLGLDGGTGSLDDAMAAATANVVAGDGMSVDNVSLDLSMAGDMGLGGPSNAGGGLDLGDNDLFSGLDTGDDFQWDNMDLS
ncbi:Mediator of RNA polymerase II transcription subunit 5 [Colletotrichum sp. SAR 10_65]|nr:Mediator of RNA polymerase II transcription subunit 5 [Colletotrichum sp. SAR 10_75]KAI8187944.1 Mediator of RNA polymerase II transcription subunit 5 [Colletotrichum sp. SAR 10_65]KAJ4996120.1 Mediator of RNA polymerase II transcription subunit 5 [Colletotrichum sp. SAR 10_66]